MSVSYAIRNEVNLQTVLWAIGGALYQVPGIVRSMWALLVWCLPGVLVLAKVAVLGGLLMAALAVTIMFTGWVVCAGALVLLAYVSMPRG
jgi:hypothetical protein